MSTEIPQGNYKLSSGRQFGKKKKKAIFKVIRKISLCPMIYFN